MIKAVLNTNASPNHWQLARLSFSVTFKVKKKDTVIWTLVRPLDSDDPNWDLDKIQKEYEKQTVLKRSYDSLQEYSEKLQTLNAQKDSFLKRENTLAKYIQVFTFFKENIHLSLIFHFKIWNSFKEIDVQVAFNL